MYKLNDLVEYYGENSTILAIVSGSTFWRVFKVFDNDYFELQSVNGGLWLIARTWEIRHAK